MTLDEDLVFVFSKPVSPEAVDFAFWVIYVFCVTLLLPLMWLRLDCMAPPESMFVIWFYEILSFGLISVFNVMFVFDTICT